MELKELPNPTLHFILFTYFLRLYLFFREKGKKGERERIMDMKHGCARHTSIVAPCTPPAGDLVRNPGMCPDQEPNQ